MGSQVARSIVSSATLSGPSSSKRFQARRSRRCVAWTHERFEPIRQDREAVEIEQTRDGVTIVPQIVFVGFLHGLCEVLPLDQQQRNAVDETHRIRTPLVQIALDPEL